MWRAASRNTARWPRSSDCPGAESLAWPGENARFVPRGPKRAFMTLDVQTLLILMMTNLVVVSIALPAVVGWRVSPPARAFQGSVIAQAQIGRASCRERV